MFSGPFGGLMSRGIGRPALISVMTRLVSSVGSSLVSQSIKNGIGRRLRASTNLEPPVPRLVGVLTTSTPPTSTEGAYPVSVNAPDGTETIWSAVVTTAGAKPVNASAAAGTCTVLGVTT